jgi:phosphoribosylformylglycinamidine cyclo-ligase
VRTFAHVTGGGLTANLARVLPAGLTAELDRTTWTPAPVFKLIAGRGRVDRDEMEHTFNMGVGMVAVLPPDDVERAQAVLTARHVPSWVIGEVRRSADVPDVTAEEGRGAAVLRGDHPRF